MSTHCFIIGMLGLILFTAGVQSLALAETWENDLQSWNVVTLKFPLSPNKKLQGYMEAQPRIGGLQEPQSDNRDFSALILRPAVGIQLNKHVSLWQGYAWAPIFEPVPRNEHRIFQQAVVEHSLKKLNVTHRTRLEERWIERASGTSVRARQMLRVAIPISKSGKLRAVAYDELFVNLNSPTNGPQAGVDQNRGFVGLNYSISPTTNIEGGYMNNIITRIEPVPNRINHIIQLTINMHIR